MPNPETGGRVLSTEEHQNAPSSVRSALRRPTGAHRLEDDELQPVIAGIFADNCKVYGASKIKATLKREHGVIVDRGKLEEETHRFGQLRRAVPVITQKMLTQTLRRLEQDGLVHREVLVQMRPPQVEYSLTELGRTVTAPLAAMRDWTEQHLPDVQAARQRFDELEPA